MSDCSREYSHHAAKLFLTQHSNTKNNDPLGISDKNATDVRKFQDQQFSERYDHKCYLTCQEKAVEKKLQ